MQYPSPNPLPVWGGCVSMINMKCKIHSRYCYLCGRGKYLIIHVGCKTFPETVTCVWRVCIWSIWRARCIPDTGTCVWGVCVYDQCGMQDNSATPLPEWGEHVSQMMISVCTCVRCACEHLYVCTCACECACVCAYVCVCVWVGGWVCARACVCDVCLYVGM